MKTYRYETDCVSCGDGNAINEMTDRAIAVTWRTILKHCEGVREWAQSQGYDRHLWISDDYAVSFHRSKFCGRKCYYICWSSIEFIWTEQERALNSKPIY